VHIRCPGARMVKRHTSNYGKQSWAWGGSFHPRQLVFPLSSLWVRYLGKSSTGLGEVSKWVMWPNTVKILILWSGAVHSCENISWYRLCQSSSQSEDRQNWEADSILFRSPQPHSVKLLRDQASDACCSQVPTTFPHYLLGAKIILWTDLLYGIHNPWLSLIWVVERADAN